MAVRSEAFGGVMLSGVDANKFVEKLTRGRTSKAARTTLSNGSAMASELRTNGKVLIKLKK